MKKEKKQSGSSVSLKERIRRQFGSSQSKNGSYSLAMIAVVLVITVFVNLIVGQLPKSATSFDISSSLIYETGEVTQEVLDSLNHDVSILVIAENDSVDSRIQTFLERYTEKSSHVTLTYRDPVLHPDVLTQYGVSSNTIVVSCEDTGKIQTVAISDMIQYDQYYYYYQGAKVESEFDGEGLMTTAIDYVASDKQKKIYTLDGHSESDLSDSVTEQLGKSHMETESLNLMEKASVPEDCGLLVINAPQSDLADDELQTIRTYLIGGGNVMLLRGVTKNTLTNFDALMEEYGLTMVNQYIGDQENYYANAGSYFNLFPVIKSSSANVSTDSMILVSSVAGMLQSENADDSVSVQQLLTTGSKTILLDPQNTSGQYQTSGETYLLAAKSTKTYEAGAVAEGTDKDTGLVQGTDAQAEESTEELTKAAESEAESAAELSEAASEETTAEETDTAAETETGAESEAASDEAAEAGTTGTMIVLTAPSMIEESITGRFSNLANLEEFTNLSASFFDDVQNISIPTKSLAVEYNTVTNGGVWNSLFLFVIPAFCIAAGLYVWIKRRRA